MKDQDAKRVLDIATLCRLAVYAVVAGAAAVFVTASAFPQWSQDGIGAKLAVVGALCGLVYAVLARVIRIQATAGHIDCPEQRPTMAKWCRLVRRTKIFSGVEM